MAKYKDLEPLDYFGARWADKLTAIGWIESAEQCTSGNVDAAFFDTLHSLLVEPWQPFVASGSHRCTLCRFTGGPGTVGYGSRTVQMGHSNLFIPSQERVYAAPSTIVHYIDAHGYCPPREFQDAVLDLPPMRSMDYLKLIRRHDLHRRGA